MHHLKKYAFDRRFQAEGKAKKVQALGQKLEVMKSTHSEVKAADPAT